MPKCVVVDSTFASPAVCRPLEHGVDDEADHPDDAEAEDLAQKPEPSRIRPVHAHPAFEGFRGRMMAPAGLT